MGSRGPQPTPTKILEARGSWRAKGRQGEPQLPVEAPSCPAWLPAEGKAEWRRQVKLLVQMGVISKADRALLAAYCEAWAELVALTCAIDERLRQDLLAGYAWAVKDGLINAKAKAVDRLMKLADRFGFSPAARARLRAPEQPESKDSGKGRFFNAG